MRGIQWVLIVVAVVIIVVVGFVLIVKPTLVLPTYTVVSPDTTTLGAYQKQLNISQLDVKIRTDGKVLLLADGKDIADMSYNAVSLTNTVNIAKKMVLPPTAIKAIGVLPILFPHLALNLFLTSQTIYFVLPIEMTVRFVQG